MDKRKAKNHADSIKKKRKVITLEKKLQVIKRHENGASNVKIGQEFGFSESTVRTILSKIIEYKEQGKVASTSHSMQITRNRSLIMIEMERLLSLWVKDCNQNKIPLRTKSIQAKALNIFAALKENKFKGEMETFGASFGWFDRFKNRSELHNVKIVEESASADKVAAANFPDSFSKIVEDEGYENRRIFNVNETGLFCKKISFQTFLTREETSQPGYKGHGVPLDEERSEIQNEGMSTCKVEVMDGLEDDDKPEPENDFGSFEIPEAGTLAEVINSTSELEKSLPQVSETSQSLVNGGKSETEFDLFAKSIAVQLNNMSLNDALRLQLKIQEVITEFRLNVPSTSRPSRANPSRSRVLDREASMADLNIKTEYVGDSFLGE